MTKKLCNYDGLDLPFLIQPTVSESSMHFEDPYLGIDPTFPDQGVPSILPIYSSYEPVSTPVSFPFEACTSVISSLEAPPNEWPLPINSLPSTSLSSNQEILPIVQMQVLPVVQENINIRAVPAIHTISRDHCPGEFDFKVSLRDETKWHYDTVKKYLVIKRNVDFAVTFTTNEPLPSTAVVRVMVVYADFIDMQKKDPIKRCLKDTRKDTDIGDRFMACKNDGVEYKEYEGHHVILVPVVNMPCSTSGPFAVFSFFCQSSCLSHGNKSPPLLLVFHLLDNDKEIGCDSIKLRICACVNRDFKKIVGLDRPPKRSLINSETITSPEKKRKFDDILTNDIHSQLHLTDTDQPDEDGYYQVMWRGKSRLIYNLMMMLKRGAEIEELANQ